MIMFFFVLGQLNVALYMNCGLLTVHSKYIFVVIITHIQNTGFFCQLKTLYTLQEFEFNHMPQVQLAH